MNNSQLKDRAECRNTAVSHAITEGLGSFVSDFSIPQLIVAGGVSKYKRDKQKTARVKRVLLALAGILLGGVNGIFGSGGGMFAVPALSFLYGLNDKQSHATAIAVILPLCFISSIIYALRAPFDMSIVMPTVFGVFIGGILGAVLLKKLSSDIISFLFYGLMLLAGIKMIMR